MSASKTLRSLAGLPDTPPLLSESALVLVDCQNTYREGVMGLIGVEPALERCRTLLGRARRLGIPIIHVQHDDGEGSLYDIRAHIGQIADPVRPLADEPVVVKSHPNSFHGTSLQEQLQAKGARRLVIVGFMTHLCISSTARAAFELGYPNVVVASGTATRSLELKNGEIPASDLQAASLAGLADLFSIVVAEPGDLRD
jgi:nicotinamidase-related amidase